MGPAPKKQNNADDQAMKPYKCSICGKCFDDSRNAKRHVGARNGACFRRCAVVQRSNIEIRASDRIVGGREHVDDYGMSSPPVPAFEDDETEGEPDDDLVPDTVPSDFRNEGMRDLIETLRSAVSGDDIVQAFNASAAQTVAPIGIADERPDTILNYSQRRIVQLRAVYKLNLSSTNAIMSLVQDPKFNPSELGTDRVQKLERALLRGHARNSAGVRAYDFHREGDGNQDLKMYILECKQVASDLFGDPLFKGHMTFNFVPTFDDEGRRTFGSAMGGVWAQFHARAVVDCVEVLLVLAIYIDASYVKVNLTVKPIYCT